ncbi:MAG: hypothetical protein U1E03_12410 [Hyphomonadaceae bacterium]
MNEPVSKYANPYWDGHIKPHRVEPDEIKNLCLRAFQCVMSTHGVASIYTNAEAEEEEQDLDIPLLLELYRERAEPDLSASLLRIAILLRTLEDQIIDIDTTGNFSAFLADLNADPDEYGTVFEGDGITLRLRECCNKIIHAADFRPVYDNSNSPTEYGGWAMDGQLELQGIRGSKPWSVTIYLTRFLEGALAFCDEAKKY